jgi:hypothetical protein
MNNSRVLAISKTDLIIISILLAIASLAPLVRNQFVTGTIVNATLLIAVCSVGVYGGLLVAVVPSMIALTSGLLPAVLAPMVPIIIIGNVLLVLVFAGLRKPNYWLGAITAAVLKFGFLAGMTGLLAGLLVNAKMVSSVMYMLSWPQLLTALAGGLLAYRYFRMMGNRAQQAEK